MKKLFACCFPREEKDTSDINLKRDINALTQLNTENNKAVKAAHLYSSEEDPLHIRSAEKTIFYESSSILQMQELEGQMMNNQVVKVNQHGMINGVRKKKDGVTYFGFNTSIGNQNNDFVFEPEQPYDKGFDRFLRISFDRESRSYYLSCDNYNDDCCAVFIKIERVFKIVRRHLISLGHVHLSIDLDHKNLIVEVIQSNEETKTINFPPEKASVKVGRSKDNEIVLDNTAFSRIHSYFFFLKEENAWFLNDGYEGKPSTNGTWYK